MKYIRKPIEVEAIQWTGDNTPDVLDFIGSYHQWMPGSENTMIIIVDNELEPLRKGDYLVKNNDDCYPVRACNFEKYNMPEDVWNKCFDVME